MNTAMLKAALEPHVTSGAVSGLVALVARRNADTEVVALGSREIGGEPVAADSIFRVASMTS